MRSQHLLEQPESIAYQCALKRWEEFHTACTGSNLASCLRDQETTPPEDMAIALRVLPASERVPVAFGVFLRASKQWSGAGRASFRGEFLPDPSPIEREILDAAERGVLQMPEKLPVTLEEFPSRIWQRAQASGSRARLIRAGALAVREMKRLFYQYGDVCMEAPTVGRVSQVDESLKFLTPVGVPDVFDLVAYPPSGLHELKTQALNKIQNDVIVRGLCLNAKQRKAISAWIHLNTSEGPRHAEAIANDTRTKMEAIAGNAIPKASALFELHRLGRFLFRLGRRGEALRCTKPLGISPWERGWQFQAVAPHVHTRIRNAVIKRAADANVDSWLHDPALASSAMSRPLWLNTTVSRLPELIALFTRAADCPWTFPRLHDIFQWHLALADKQDELRAVVALAPDWAGGLSLPRSRRDLGDPVP